MRFQIRPTIININVSDINVSGRGVTGDKIWLVCTKHLNGSTVLVPQGSGHQVLSRGWKFLQAHSLFYSYQETSLSCTHKRNSV